MIALVMHLSDITSACGQKFPKLVWRSFGRFRRPPTNHASVGGPECVNRPAIVVQHLLQQSAQTLNEEEKIMAILGLLSERGSDL